MTPKPTYDDATLILRLYELRREARLRQARAWFFANCKGVKSYEELMKIAPGGSDENASFRMVTSYWDLAASFVTSGVLHKELFFQSGRELLLVWERVRALVPSMRDAYQDAHYLRHLEAVGNEFAAWWKKDSPGAYEAFVKRVT